MSFFQWDKSDKKPGEPSMSMKTSGNTAEQPGESKEAGQLRPQHDPRAKAMEK